MSLKRLEEQAARQLNNNQNTRSGSKPNSNTPRVFANQVTLKIPAPAFPGDPQSTLEGFFVGSGDEPHYWYGHRVRRSATWFTLEPCSGDGCWYCAQNDAGDASIIRAVEQASFNFYVITKFHTTELVGDDGRPIKNKKNESVFRHVKCTSTKTVPCPLCRKKEPYLPRGLVVLTYAARVLSEGFLTEIKKYSQYCAQCVPKNGNELTGEIECTGSQCTSCGRKYTSPADQLKDRCVKCNTPQTLEDLLTCTNGCEEPRRISIWDGRWTITRVGAGKNTTYGFSMNPFIQRPANLPDDLYDLKQLHAPASPERQESVVRGKSTTPKGRQQNTRTRPSDLNDSVDPFNGSEDIPF